jgi:hypothetical protein
MLPLILGLVGGGFLVSAFTEDKKYAKGGGISGTLHSEHKSPLEYLKAMGAKTNSDLNYSTKKSGIDYYVGRKGNKAIVVAFVEDESKYMIDKEDAREMAETANTKGIESVELYTNYGIELHSKNESPKTVGFDKIYKVTSNFAKGGEMSDGGKMSNKIGETVLEFDGKNGAKLQSLAGNIWIEPNGQVHAEINGETKNIFKDDKLVVRNGIVQEVIKPSYVIIPKDEKTKRKSIMIKKEGKKVTGTKKANPQTNKMKEVIAHAKATRKDGEAWKSAVARAWKEMGK